MSRQPQHTGAPYFQVDAGFYLGYTRVHANPSTVDLPALASTHLLTSRKEVVEPSLANQQTI